MNWSQKDLNEDQILPPTKIGRFELNEEVNKICLLDSNLADYVNNCIQNFMPNQTLNPIPTNNKSENHLDPYLRELMLEQGKHIPLRKNKLLSNLQEKIIYVYGPLGRTWTAI